MVGESFKAVKITDRICWVGAVDWDLRNFHGYLTSRGTTYNAFLVMTDKVTLIDTVKPQFYDEMMARISDVVDPRAISYVISNHAEMDHSGSLPRLLDAYGDKTLVASKKGAEALDHHFHWNQEVQVVGDGDSVDLGNGTLKFVEARMLHWPDSMYTFLEEDGVLFTNDGFGMHLATSERFADEIDPSIIRYEAAKYFANILLPFSGIVKKQIKKLTDLNLDLKMILPDHGPVFRKDFDKIIEWYGEWADQKPTNKAVLLYDTMWQSTEKMARAVCDGLTEGGARTVLMPLAGSHRSDVATEILDAGALVVGSPTMNNQLYPTVADAMTYISGLKPRNLVGACFGSYGWSGESLKKLATHLGEMKIELVGEPLGVNYVPKDEDLATCRALGSQVAARMLERQ